jgi:hypothetical protein
MEAYKFDTTVLQGGTFRIPECARFANRSVEVFVVLKTSEEQHQKYSQSIEEFLNKWTGFLGDVDPDALKYEYLQKKYT